MSGVASYGVSYLNLSMINVEFVFDMEVAVWSFAELSGSKDCVLLVELKHGRRYSISPFIL